MRIGLDLDNVIFNYTHEFKEWCEAVYEQDFSEPLTWEFWMDWGWDEEQFAERHRDFVTAWGYEDGEIIGGQKTLDAINWARGKGHEIIIVTARYTDADQFDEIKAQTKVWLRENSIQYDELHFSHDKSGFSDTFLDDKYETFLKLCRSGETEGWLFKQPWNRGHVHLYENWEVSSVADYIKAVVSNHEAETAGNPFGNETVKYFDGNVEDFPLVPRPEPEEVRVVNEKTGGAKGSKLARFDLIPAEALRKVAVHYGIGAAKYQPWNWRRGYDWSLSLAALERHLNAFKAREDIDEETNSPHMAAVAFHALALLTFMDEHPELDDRYKQEV